MFNAFLLVAAATVQVPYREVVKEDPAVALAKVVMGKPFAKAAAFAPLERPCPVTFFEEDGRLVLPFQAKLPPAWQPLQPHETQLVVVLGGHKKQSLDYTFYFSSRRIVERFRWVLEVKVIEAKTGDVLAQRVFINALRALKPEDAAATEVGCPVAFGTVFEWLRVHAPTGFLGTSSFEPTVTVSE